MYFVEYAPVVGAVATLDVCGLGIDNFCHSRNTVCNSLWMNLDWSFFALFPRMFPVARDALNQYVHSEEESHPQHEQYTEFPFSLP